MPFALKRNTDWKSKGTQAHINDNYSLQSSIIPKELKFLERLDEAKSKNRVHNWIILCSDSVRGLFNEAWVVSYVYKFKKHRNNLVKISMFAKVAQVLCNGN